ncbi:type IV pili twitching motility protein PilT [Candidatus Peregrinibacteria bacterium CG11_big_fil_rev_8_21_14_0_20_46_8]|nr:MAG: type IV pili twitching motility protein PilT [Candidatus Peregrinibacteria bacterium CG11_big_fil_rev_8_21_14_0_20_46_8]
MKLDKIIRTAVAYNASDIYITTGSKPYVKISGKIVPIEEHAVLTEEAAREYIFETLNEHQQKKFLTELDLDYSIEVEGIARFRVNIFFQRKGIGAVLRYIPTTCKTMEELNLPPQLKKLTRFPNGIAMVTGPTGSGKSTTLAAILHEINMHQPKHIITIEDPIEFIHENQRSMVNQRELGTHTTSFARGLRAALREAPDVILVGEMRDLETIQLAITAAETGHLVLASLHTSGAEKSVNRIIDVFPAEQQSQVRSQLAESLRCIVWQSLLPRADNQGQAAGFEILFNNHAVGNLIRKGKTHQIPSAMETGVQEGMQTMKRHLGELVQQGIITPETAQEHIPEDIEVE